jgi:hypothetical protein
MVIYDWLDDICDDVVLAHPLKVKADRRCQDQDRQDRCDGAGASVRDRRQCLWRSPSPTRWPASYGQ